MSMEENNQKLKSTPCLQGSVCGWVRDNDFFGHVINLNFDRQGDSHKTLCGGIYSIFIKLFLIVYLYLNARKLFMPIDDNNVTTVGLLSLSDLGDVNVTNESSMLLIHVLRKQFPKKYILERDEIENHMHMYFTQEVYDYTTKFYKTVEYPWKFCSADDFQTIDKRHHKYESLDNNNTAQKLWESWDGYTIICPDETNLPPIQLYGDRSSVYSKHMQFNIRMCDKKKNPNCKNESQINEYLKDLQIDTWMA